MKYSLKELRQRKQKTQRDVATDLGISVYTYRKWEKNLGNVSIHVADVLCQYFGVTLDQLKF